MRHPQPRPSPIRPDEAETLSTEELLELHERLCAPLDPAARCRIVDAASRHGRDRRRELDRLAA
jgi:hypothetical protein